MTAGSPRSETTRRRILAAAATEFREHGYSGATLARIARRAGLQAGSLYYHFDSREDLVSEVLRLGLSDVSAAVTERLGELPPDSTPVVRLEAAIRAHAVAVLRAGDLAGAQARLGGQVPEAVKGPYREQQRVYGTLWDGLLTAARTTGAIGADVDLVAARLLVFGALNWTSEWFRPSRARSVDAVADTAVAFVLHGLLGPSTAHGTPPPTD